MAFGKPIPPGDKRIVPLEVEGVSFPGGIHRALRPVVKFALTRAVKRSGYKLRKGTCWGHSYRKIAGTDVWSNHAYGLAIDVNAPWNGRGTDGNLPRKFVRTMKFWGFEWGGDWDFTDPMHFEWRFGRAKLRRQAREARRKTNRRDGH